MPPTNAARSADVADYDSLQAAIQKKDLEGARKILGLNRSLARKLGSSGFTLLHLAIQLDQPEMANLLIENGADVNARARDGSMPIDVLPFTWNITDQDEATLDVLLVHDANVNGGTSMPLAARLILSIGGDGEAARTLDNSASEYGVRVTATLRKLLQHGADIETYDEHKNTLLIAAIARNLPALAMMLVNEGANVNAANDEGLTPLHVLAGSGTLHFEELADLLLKKGARLGVKDKQGRTPLAIAETAGNESIASYLRSHTQR